MNDYSIQVINRLIPSKSDLYSILTTSPDFEFKLPAFTSKTVSISYLLNAANGQVFTIKKAQYKECHLKSYLNKIDYFAKLGELVPNLGFDIDTLPDKKWLKDVLFSIKPDHDYFRSVPTGRFQLSER